MYPDLDPEFQPRRPTPQTIGLDQAYSVAQRLAERMASQVIGRDLVIEQVLIGLLSEGHILLEDFPGSGKTTLAKTLGEAIEDDRPEEARGSIEAFRRIQFTPDFLPSDVTGTTVFDPSTASFSFRPGPVFAHVLLADEINRTSPKVQAALLEAMGEQQVTVDNRTYPLDSLFFVIATQNPLDLAGTYPLPVAQLDRFLFKIRMTHIDRASELKVLQSMGQRRASAHAGPVVRRGEILDVREAVRAHVRCAACVHEALVDIASALRADGRVLQGVSTRSLVLAVPALSTRAMLKGRDYVNAEDLEALLPLLFGHRLQLGGATEAAEGIIQAAMAPSVEAVARQCR